MITEWEVSFYFKEESSIKSVYLQEEMIHAVQEIDIYGVEYMEQARKNIEFEAKVIQDVIMERNGEGGMYLGSANHSNDFMRAYSDWIQNNANNIEILKQRFFEFCSSWNGYKGTFAPDFEAKAIDKYLK